jgi:hypothetical protein
MDSIVVSHTVTMTSPCIMENTPSGFSIHFFQAKAYSSSRLLTRESACLLYTQSFFQAFLIEFTLTS